MALLGFDEADLTGRLERIPWQVRVLFAAACAERLAPSYATFSASTGSGDPLALGNFLSRLWEDIAGKQMADNEVEVLIKECMELWPREDDEPEVLEQSQAEDAAAAVAYALRCRRSREAQEAAWFARRVFEAIADYVATRESIDPNSPDAEIRVLAHPLVQSGLSRQDRDLDELAWLGQADVRDVARRFHDRAKREPAIVFPVPP